MSIPESILIAAISVAFGAGTMFAALSARVRLAIRMARRAHQRLDELEDATGTRSALRDYPD